MGSLTDAMRSLTAHTGFMPSRVRLIVARVLLAIRGLRDRRLARQYDRARGYDKPRWTRRNTLASRLSEADRARIGDTARMRDVMEKLTDRRNP